MAVAFSSVVPSKVGIEARCTLSLHVAVALVT
jgi:hypothetical protein